MNLISHLNWRYATKRMTGEKVPQEKLDNILESIRLSASSIGLQPYTILVIDNAELQEKIKAVANNQAQITEASQILVFAAWEKITQEKIENFIDLLASERNQTQESLAGLKNTLTTISNRPEDVNFNWAARQAYIALGTGIIAAAVESVDATPIEGFNAPALDKLLGIEEKGLKSLAILALGYRDQKTDWLEKLPKVRTPKEKLFVHYTNEVEVF